MLHDITRMVDIRDPELCKQTGVGFANCRNVVDVRCPYGRDNALMHKRRKQASHGAKIRIFEFDDSFAATEGLNFRT